MSNDLARLSRAVQRVEGEARERGLQALGEEPALSEDLQVFLLSKPFIGASIPPLRIHMDPQDDDRSMKELMRDEVHSLPKAPVAAPPAEKAPRIKRADPSQRAVPPRRPRCDLSRAWRPRRSHPPRAKGPSPCR